ncbi:MAG: flagellar hook-associated protein FlgK [Tissierellia bacterium]|nr:flagellar hook-associated protein FlgK [Tissierellia bacterium]
MLRSTFIGYKTATGALKVNQYMLDVVGQNISNINTEGYTRQRLDINSVSINAVNMKLGTSGTIIGQGVEAKGVSQFRDVFLDLRYRMEASKTGSEYIQLEALEDLEEVFDEITMYGLDAQFSDLITQLHSLTSSPSDPVLEGVVRTSAQMLTQMFNNYSKEIETIEAQQLSYLKTGAIVKVNQLSENIAKLNRQIRESNISGNPALELNDQRNMLIDELSNYLDIEVDIEPLDIGGGKTIDELVISLRDSKDSDGNAIKIIDRNNFNQLRVTTNSNKVSIEMTKRDADGKIVKDGDGNVEYQDISFQIKGGRINGYLKFLNGKGEFASSADEFENSMGVQYYSSMLDTLAEKFATTMNNLNQIPSAFDSDGNVTDWIDRPLFDTKDKTGKITAGNIKITDAWAEATESYITNSIVNPKGDNSGATDNILRIINSFQESKTYYADEDENKALFEGTYQEFLSFTTTKLNLQVSSTEISFDTYRETLFHIDYARSSMSSVDLNEEGVNLLQYSKSYNAAARLMTTLDEMLDTLINRMGV